VVRTISTNSVKIANYYYYWILILGIFTAESIQKICNKIIIITNYKEDQSDIIMSGTLQKLNSEQK